MRVNLVRDAIRLASMAYKSKDELEALNEKKDKDSSKQSDESKTNNEVIMSKLDRPI